MPNPRNNRRPQGANGKACRSELGSLVARYDVSFDDEGLIKSSRRLAENDPATFNTWFAYVEPNPPSEWFNGQTYVDTLNPNAIKRFNRDNSR